MICIVYLNWREETSTVEKFWENNSYWVDKLRDFHGVSGDALPIVLFSKSGKFLKDALTPNDAFEDTEIEWVRPNAETTAVFGGQGMGKTWLALGVYTIQLASFDIRFGIRTMPYVILDAWGEVNNTYYTSPLQTPRYLRRLKNYWKYFPYLRPIDLRKKTVLLGPSTYRKQLAARGIYDDFYFGLKAEYLKRLDKQQAKKLVMELLGISEDDPSERMVRRGLSALEGTNPTFLDIYRAILRAVRYEQRARHSLSVSRLADFRLNYVLQDGEVEIGENINFKKMIDSEMIQILHLPIQSLESKLYQVLFGVLLLNYINFTKEGSPPIGGYFEEAHKIVEAGGILYKTFKDLYQLERKGGRRIVSILRMPSYAREMIDEFDCIITPRLSDREASLLLDYTPDFALKYRITTLRTNFREASEWMFLRKGDPDTKRGFPIPTMVEPSRERVMRFEPIY